MTKSKVSGSAPFFLLLTGAAHDGLTLDFHVSDPGMDFLFEVVGGVAVPIISRKKTTVVQRSASVSAPGSDVEHFSLKGRRIQ